MKRDMDLIRKILLVPIRYSALTGGIPRLVYPPRNDEFCYPASVRSVPSVLSAVDGYASVTEISPELLLV